MPPRILVVDDEDNQRKLLGMGLRSESFEVFEAADGEEALLFLEGGGVVDLAIIDLMMPGINGLDLARRMRIRAPRVRVVLTSAYHLNSDQLRRADCGAVGFIPKPCDLDEMVSFLRAKLRASSSTPPSHLHS